MFKPKQKLNIVSVDNSDSEEANVNHKDFINSKIKQIEKKNKTILNNYEDYNLDNELEQLAEKNENQNKIKSLHNNDKPKYINSILQSNKERKNMHLKAKETIDKIKVEAGLVEIKEVFITNNYSKFKNIESNIDSNQIKEPSNLENNKIIIEANSNIVDFNKSISNITTKVEENKKDSLEVIKQRYLERKRLRESEVIEEKDIKNN